MPCGSFSQRRKWRVIEIRHICKSFPLNARQRREEGRREKSFKALDGVSLTCSPGRVLTLLGPNGAGKTTLLRMVATMLHPDAGTICVAGHDSVKEPAAVRRHLGFLTGSTGLYDRLTTEETLRYFADLHGLEGRLFQARRDELVERLDLAAFLHRRVGRLSTGMRQRVSIARTLIHDPPVLVLDEPTSGLDILAARSIVDLIRDCRREGRTLLFSTHRMDEVRLLSDDLAVVHNGRLLFSDSYAAFEQACGSMPAEDFFTRLTTREPSS
jgi:sodium transport system ATP-binding protein